MSTPEIEPSHLKPAINAAVQLWNEQGKRHWVSVTGGSMQPLMRPGDRVLLAHSNTGIRVGDVIVFWQNNLLLIHRVIRIDRRADSVQFLTKGDNAPSFDPRVSLPEVIGKVVMIERANRQISLETKPWQAFGYWMAWTALMWHGFLVIGIQVKHRLLGKQPNRLTQWIRVAVTQLPSRVLRVWLAWFGHWK